MNKSKMTDPRTIAVVGACGATAGGLARAILDNPEAGFRCRAITRTPDSDAAKALAARGATVVRADLDDPDSLVAAFDGAYGAFCMTPSFATGPEQETQRATNQARAAAAAGVRHAIWVTCPDTRQWFDLDDPHLPTLQGSYKVPQWDAKADGDARFAAAGVPTTRLLAPFHWEAFVFGMGAPQRGPDGVLAIAVPIGGMALPGIANDDIGRCALGIFQSGDPYLGEAVGIAGEHVTCSRIAAGLGEIMGEPVNYVSLPVEVFRTLPFPGVDLAANMFQVVAEVPAYAALHDVDHARRLNPGLRSFDDWVAATRQLVSASTLVG